MAYDVPHLGQVTSMTLVPSWGSHVSLLPQQ